MLCYSFTCITQKYLAETMGGVMYKLTQSVRYFCKIGILILILQVKNRYSETLCNLQSIVPLDLLKFVSNHF